MARLLPHDDRLKYADLSDTVDKFAQLIFIEGCPGLARVRINQVHPDFAELSIRNRIDAGLYLIVVSGRGRVAGAIAFAPGFTDTGLVGPPGNFSCSIVGGRLR
ncbi:hypothetical protein GCM10009813_20160 [Brevibacterium marinum]|uniref:Uncharacterized protein n=1 Tax=Brevibacterium marinum TaxID=418643 RepID=A0A846RPC9_9MICO|nr:hypothetical protein [Brevibacterium marinum]